MCGYSKDIPGAYDFHHRDAKEKEFSISGYKVLNLEKMKKESDKCNLLCKNWHAEVHDIDRRGKRNEFIKKHDDWIKDKKVLENIECKYCKNIFHPKNARQKYCNINCKNFAHRKVKNNANERIE